MSEAAETIQTEGTEGGNIQAAEGNEPHSHADIDLTEISEQQQQQDDFASKRDSVLSKYKDEDALVKAVIEKDKELGRIRREVPQAPEDYKFNFEGVDGLPEGFELPDDDELLGEFVPVFKDANLSGEQAQKLVSKFVQIQQEQAVDFDAEEAKLGADKDEILGRLNNFKDARLSDEEKATFESMAVTADQAKLLSKLVALGGEKPIAENVDTVPSKSPQELRDEAFEYRTKHARTISANKKQQEHYESLLKQANQLESLQEDK